MFLSNNDTVHTCHKVCYETTLLFYPHVQFADINRFCHIFLYLSFLLYNLVK